MRPDVERSLLTSERTPEGLRARLCFDPDLPVFEGHFPARPIVPGVFLIEAVRLAAERVIGGRLQILEVVEPFMGKWLRRDL